MFTLITPWKRAGVAFLLTRNVTKCDFVGNCRCQASCLCQAAVSVEIGARNPLQASFLALIITERKQPVNDFLKNNLQFINIPGKKREKRKTFSLPLPDEKNRLLLLSGRESAIIRYVAFRQGRKKEKTRPTAERPTHGTPDRGTPGRPPSFAFFREVFRRFG